MYALLRSGDARLVTLTGPGGVGKTRLALRVTAELANDSRDQARFVPLMSVRDMRLVSSTLARSLGAHDEGIGSFAEQVESIARDSDATLLIDNFEHVLPAGPLLTELLAVCPRLTVLVTSRERLRLSGEHVVPVLPLAYPDPDHLPPLAEVSEYPAVRLFVERARAVDTGFTLTEENAAVVAAVCQRVDGLPLALELAAARTVHLSPAALLARLARRLPLLTGGPRDLPARLQTMRDAIAWSYDLLGSEDRSLFQRLAVFEGGFTLSSAAAIASATGWEPPVLGISPQPTPQVLDVIASLVDRNLVRRADAAHDTEPRFDMLETIREFGLEKLAASDEEHAVRQSHAEICLAMVETPGDIDHLHAELANLRAALTWSCAGYAPDIALRLAAGLGRFWLTHDYLQEGRHWLEVALGAAPDGQPELRSAALSALARLLRELGEPALARESAQRGLELAQGSGSRPAEATSLTTLALLSDDIGDNERTRALSEASVAICRNLDDRHGLAGALNSLGWAEAGMGRVEIASAHFHEALGHFEATGDRYGVAHTLSNLANVLAEQGQFADARPLLEQALDMARSVSGNAEMVEITSDLGWLKLEVGDVPAACSMFAEGLGLLRQSGRLRHAVFALEGCAVVAEASGLHNRAARLASTTTAIRERMRLPISLDPRHVAIRGRTPARDTLKRLVSMPADTPVWSLDTAFREAETMLAILPSDMEQSPPLFDLTWRQRGVLQLLAAGHTDREIADALFISRRTASKHVAAILDKLGVSNRLEAAMLAKRDDLI